MCVDFLLYNVESPINIGQVLHTADVYGMSVFICDGPGVFEDPYKRRVIADFANGALGRRPPLMVRPDVLPALLGRGRRNIATSVLPEGRRVQSFTFFTGDLVIVGNDLAELDERVLASCHAQLTLPMLPVGAVAAVIAHQAILVEPAQPVAFGEEPTRETQPLQELSDAIDGR